MHFKRGSRILSDSTPAGFQVLTGAGESSRRPMPVLRLKIPEFMPNEWMRRINREWAGS
jgi:hypothetical protein